ncbi:MAG: FadR family transcriptional regulator [Alphaproteobacteria bacterium]|nr:FadR family transcriptional regulator [Alphaproteobacteria bacterium]
MEKNIAPPLAAGYSHAAIAAALGSEILSGARSPGSRLPSVEEMNARFGVSRVVVREVIKTLTAKGLVASKTKVGTVVREPAAWNWLDAEVLGWRLKAGLDRAFLEQIVAVRSAIEPAAAALAARHRTAKDLSQLRACIAAMRAAEGDTARYAEADVAFHLALGRASGNPLVGSFGPVIKVALGGLIALSAAGVKQAEKGHGGSTTRHAAIVEAIADRNERAARAAMQRVIDRGGKHAGRGLGR